MNLSRFTSPVNNELLAIAKTFIGHEAPVSGSQPKCEHKAIVRQGALKIAICGDCGRIFGPQETDWLLGTKMKAD